MFGWTYIDGTGEESGASHRFEDLCAAEDWMGQSWQGLHEFGVTEVVLHDHASDRRVYRRGIQLAE